MGDLAGFLRSRAQGGLLPWALEADAAERHARSAAQACKVLLAEGRSLSRRILFVDLLTMEFDEIAIPGAAPVREGQRPYFLPTVI